MVRGSEAAKGARPFHKRGVVGQGTGSLFRERKQNTEGHPELQGHTSPRVGVS